MKTILDLLRIRANLAKPYREVFERIYSVSIGDAALKVPKTFEDKVYRYMSAKKDDGTPAEDKKAVLDKVRKQKIVHVTDKVLHRGALFNSLRALRPNVQAGVDQKELEKACTDRLEGCDFCDPENNTTTDEFGSVKHSDTVAVSNIAKYDIFNSIVIFNKHNPLDFNQNDFSEYINCAKKWFKKVESVQEKCVYPFLIWNCLPKSGSSIQHGHMQLLVSTKMYSPLSVEDKNFQNYKQTYRSDYLEDVAKLHEKMSLGKKFDDTSVFPVLTPRKEKETWIVSSKLSQNFIETMYSTVRGFIDLLGVSSFNFSLRLPLLHRESEKELYIGKIIDRGSVFSKVSDFGAMELFGDPVIASDPFRFWEKLEGCY